MLPATLFPEPHAQTAGRVIDGEAVLILADAGEINVLNHVGSRIFALCDGAHSLAAIAEAISGEFDVSYEEAERDVSTFVHQLVRQDVLVFRDPSQATTP